MAKTLLRAGFFLLLISITNLICTRQSKTKEATEKLFAQLADDEKALATCQKIVREEQIKKFGKVLRPIAGYCSFGCPVRVVMPSYPEIAKRSNIRGEVSGNDRR